MAKRSAAGNGSLRHRPDGRWEARYIVGIDPGTGDYIRRSVYGKTQKEVREKLRAATTAVDEGTYFEPAKMTVGEWLDEWLALYTQDIKPLTYSSYEVHVRNNIKPYIGAIKLASLDAPTIQRMYNQLQKRTDGKKPLSPKSIKNLHGVLHKCLKQAVDIGYIRTNPSDACVLPKIVKAEVQPLESDQIPVLYQALQGERYRLVYLIDLFTGMRQGEILGLSWDCINFDTNQIYIKKQLQKQKKKDGKFYFAPLKNSKTRTITVAPSVMVYLKEQKSKQAQMRLLAGPLWNPTGEVYKDSSCKALCNDANLVFTHEDGKHLVAMTVYKHFKKVMKKLDIPDKRFHDLRHSFATASLECGDDIKTVQANLGHATASFTLDVYGHASERMKAESANRMEQYISRHKSG